MAARQEKARAPIAQVAHTSTLPAAHLATIVRQALIRKKKTEIAPAVTSLPRRLSEAQVRVACATQGTRATESLPATSARRGVNRALAKTITTETQKAAGVTHARGIQCLEREARLFPNAIA